MSTDQNQRTIERVLDSSMAFESKMLRLLCLEDQIEREYAQGTSTVKPISIMTPDDLVQ